MRVAVWVLIDTEDYGKKEFKKEVVALVKDIDTNAKVVGFDMDRVHESTTIEDLIRTK